MDQLADYLREAARLPFVWGRHDCAMFIADWVRLRTGRDGAAALRGRYASPEEAARMHGALGLAGTVRQCAAAAGLARTRSPQPGDIAVLRHGPVIGCSIRTPRGWALRMARAIVVVPDARVVAAWTVR
jgi:hypothetical protein